MQNSPEPSLDNRRRRRTTLPPDQEILRRVERLVGDQDYVLAGPWAGEVGYELLYWIPFLRWVTEQIPGLAQRLTVCSRGGVQPWYADITTDYVELFDLMSPEQIEEERLRLHATEERQARLRRLTTPVGVKRGGDLDTAIVRLAAERAGVDRYAVIAPALVYKLLRSLREPDAVYRPETIFKPRRIQPPTETPELPDEFVAVRFYEGGGTPGGTPEVAAAIARIVDNLSEAMPVVTLDPGIQLDQHRDFPLRAPVHRLPRLAPRENLGVLTAVTAKAFLYVGSYGGMSYVAPYVGVPAITWLAQPPDSTGVGEIHLAMVRRLLASPEFGDYVVLTPALCARKELLGHVLRGLG